MTKVSYRQPSAKNPATHPSSAPDDSVPAASADEPIPYRLTQPLAEPAQRPRTARDLYREAVRSRLGLDPGPEALQLYDRPDQMTAGEMLLWALGGCCLSDDLFEAMLGVCEDLRRIAIPDGAVGEAIEGLTMRLEVIAHIHHGALRIMQGVQLDGGAA